MFFHEEIICNLMAWMAHWHFVRVVSQRTLKSELGKIAVLVDECTKLLVKMESSMVRRWRWCEEHDIMACSGMCWKIGIGCVTERNIGCSVVVVSIKN